MNIRLFNTINTKIPSFCAKRKITSTNSDNALQSDVVELSTKTQRLPQKLELTEIEKEFDEVLVKYNRVAQNAETQKDLLKNYYSAQDKYDYQELLREKRNLLNQLKRISKKVGIEYYVMETNIIEKKDYNRYAPKILRANTKAELKEVKELIDPCHLFVKTRKMLSELISQRAQEINT